MDILLPWHEFSEVPSSSLFEFIICQVVSCNKIRLPLPQVRLYATSLYEEASSPTSGMISELRCIAAWMLGVEVDMDVQILLGCRCILLMSSRYLPEWRQSPRKWSLPVQLVRNKRTYPVRTLYVF